ncbi:fractalkine-like isoform X2 [Sparus aurata]|uniref:fractalkine-like isoform X2 n=1 Tax=Sparus aurata TaxID=8175 RepID=UPI0011C1AD55|nr:fractalkine-like isoform X2 [Sparus aurata]
MRISLVFATLLPLCFTMWMSIPDTCCFSAIQSRIPMKYIASYTFLDDRCSIKAILLRTKRGREICADPNSDWVKEAMQKLDGTWHRNGPQRFRTNTGGTICSDQNGDCAKEDVLKVDEEDRKNTLQENGQNDEEATSDITPATVTTSTHTTQRENGQNDEGATSDITPATATTSKLHLTEKTKVQWENGPKTFCLRIHNTSHSYHSQQTLLFTIVLLLLYCINSKHM